jgi:hypothetical protein
MMDKTMLAQARLKAAEMDQSTLRLKAYNADSVSPREEVFCREFITTMDPAKAVISAGYTGNNARATGSKWLQRPRVKRRIEQLQKKDEVRAEMSREIYLKMLQDTYDKAMADGDYSGANKAAELMGKSLGYFVDQKAILNVTARIPDDKAAEVEEVKRLARIAGVSLE